MKFIDLFAVVHQTSNPHIQAIMNYLNFQKIVIT